MSKKRSPTIKDVASAAGVSTATVSYALNGLDKVSEKIRERVQKVAQEIGYSRNTAALALKTGRNNIIGVVLPSLNNPVFPELAKYMQDHAAKRGYGAILVDSSNEPVTEARIVELMQRHGIDGAVALLHPSFSMPLAATLPVVSLDAEFERLDCVQADHTEGGRLMAEHLYALGHRRVGMLSGNQLLSSSKKRREGFLAAAKGKLEILWEEEFRFSPTLPAEVIARIQKQDVTALACVNDLVAVAALNALKSLSLSAPQDMSVIGFDDMLWSAWPVRVSARTS